MYGNPKHVRYGDLTVADDVLVREVFYDYDELGRLTEIRQEDPDGPDGPGGQPTPVSNFNYLDSGRLDTMVETSVESPNVSITTKYKYDVRGRLERITEDSGGLNATTIYAYDDVGNLTQVTDPLNRRVGYGYDLNNRLVRIEQENTNASPGASLVPVAFFAYDALGRLSTERDVRGSVTRYLYDKRHRLTHVLAAENASVEYVYDDAGQLKDFVDGEGRATKYEYDDAGRLIEEYQPGYHASTPLRYEYDTASRVRFIRDQLDFTTEYQYNAENRLQTVIDANGDPTGYTYNSEGQLETITDALTNTTTWAYDEAGRVESETNELGDARSYLYDEYGRLAQSTDRLGRVITTEYDTLHQPTYERWYQDQNHLDNNSSNPTREFSYVFDKAGQLKDVSDGESSNTFEYDGRGQLEWTDQTLAGLSTPVRFDREYDSVNNLTQVTAQIGGTDDFVNNYSYDLLNRLKSVTQGYNGGQAVAGKRVELDYDRSSRLTGLFRFSDTLGSNSVWTSAYFNNPATGRLDGIIHADDDPLNSTQIDHAFEYDATNRLTKYTSSVDGQAIYNYDNASQLTGTDYVGDFQTDESYDYDENGNRELANGANYDTATNNRLESDGTYHYVYDAEGNRTARFEDNDGDDLLSTGDTSVTEYTWDHRNRLTEVTQRATHNGPIIHSVTHTYDPFDQWIGRTVDTDGDGTTATPERTVFVYEGGQVVLQFDGTGSADLDGSDLSHRYLWGAAVDQLLADEQINGASTAGEVLWALTDHLGSVRDLVDNAGTPRKHMSYDAFGNVEIEQHYDTAGNSISGSHAEAVDTIFGYTGRALDESTGLQNNLFRWYDSAVGRWASEDPIGFAAGDANLNRYVENEATGWIDPSGLAKGGTGEPWWNDSGWDYVNPLAYSASTGDSFGNWWNPPPIYPEEVATQFYDTSRILRQGNIETSLGGTQTENAPVAEEEIKEFLKDTATDAAIEITTAGAGGLFGKLDDVNDLRKAAKTSKSGFRSFRSLKRALGPAGKGRHWHHIVEQSKIGQFGAEAIHNVGNVISIPAPTHYRISGYYGSIQRFTDGKTVRNWLKGQSYEFQRDFGKDVLNGFGIR